MAFMSVHILASAAVIGVVAFALSVTGGLVGRRLGCLFQRRAELTGGLVLIAIGVKILIEHLSGRLSMGIWEQLGLDMARHRMVALVGAGGKTSTLYALARQAADSGRTVVVTTTTHILRHPGLPLVEEPTPERLRAALEGHGVVTVGTVFRGDKLSGAGTPEELRRAADVVLVEADGAKRLPLKAPAEYEPVIPPCADAVAAVAGMDAVGQAVGAVCHRPAGRGGGARAQGGGRGGHGLPLCTQQGGHPRAGGPRQRGGRTAGGAGHSQRHYLLSGGGAGRIRIGPAHGGAAVPGGHTGGHDLAHATARPRWRGSPPAGRRTPGRPAGRWSGGRFPCSAIRRRPF